MAKRLGQPVVIENRPGAGGNLALQAVARAPADGYTLLQVASPHAINVTLYKNPGYDLLKDFAPIAKLAVGPTALVVPQTSR
jgi:tripartite-type tricarboxylate transporter receptor subunit TctC